MNLSKSSNYANEKQTIHQIDIHSILETQMFSIKQLHPNSYYQ